ncbi:MAG: hypothetical protein ACOY42_01085 [Pseudomonadota bacterium]
MYEEVLPAEFIVEVRNQAISFFEDAIAANDVRLEKFLASHKKEEVATDEKLQKEARSLLNIRKQFQDALLAARSGGPLVFAIEAEGESGGIAKLLAEPKVRAFVDVDAVSENPKAGAARLKPESYRRDFMDPSVQTISPSDLYDVISEASNSK